MTMKTADDVRNEYIKKLTEFSAKKDEARTKDKEGKPVDRSKDIYVTDLCVWDCYCAKQVYFNKVCKKPAKPEALIRFTIGEVVHEVPLWDNEDPVLNGFEQAFEWNGIRCRMDEIDVENGIILDKKTVATLPRGAKDYVTEQLNIYRVIAEENTARPIKINQLFVLNLSVVNGEIQVLPVPMWDKQDTINHINVTMDEIKRRVAEKDPPNIPYNSKGWLCSNCQYINECQTTNGKSIVQLDEEFFGPKTATARGTIEVSSKKK